MKLSDYAERMYDRKKYSEPKLKAGDKVKLLEDDEDTYIVSKPMKKGNYTVINVRESISSKGRLLYVLQKNGAKKTHDISTICIDKLIESDLIRIM